MTKVMPRAQKFPEIARGDPKGLELGLRNYWYPVLRSEELVAGEPTAFKGFGGGLGAWRGKKRHAHVFRDKSPHRGAELCSWGVPEGTSRSGVYGLLVGGRGRWVKVPWGVE